MKNLLVLLLSVACAISLIGCTDIPSTRTDIPAQETVEAALRIRVGDSQFKVSLFDSDATRALLERLPFTIEMNELNGNEKYHYFEDAFPTASERVENINAGDLMLYGDDCLVLFYKSFPTSYSYTRLGFMNHAAGLAETLGVGQAQVTFEIAE